MRATADAQTRGRGMRAMLGMGASRKINEIGARSPMKKERSLEATAARAFLSPIRFLFFLFIFFFLILSSTLLAGVLVR